MAKPFKKLFRDPAYLYPMGKRAYSTSGKMMLNSLKNRREGKADQLKC